MLESFKILSATIPKFGEDMIDLGGHKKLRNLVCAEVSLDSATTASTNVRQIQEGLGGARSDDTSTLKGTVIEYLIPPAPPPASGSEPPTEPPQLTPHLSPTGSKAGRGWMHPRTAELMCPLKYPANPEYVQL